METTITTNNSTAITTGNSAVYNAAKANEFIQFLTRRTPGTAARYAKVTKDFANWYADDRAADYVSFQQPEHWNRVTAKDITDYRLNLLYNESYRETAAGIVPNGKKSISTINQEVSMLCKLAKIAHAAGYLNDHEYNLIRDIEGITPAEGKEVDKGRGQTRCNNAKKEAPIQITILQIELLKHDHPNTLKGKRDQLLFCLLLDHGQRIGDMLELTTDKIDMTARTITFTSQKTNCDMRLQMTADVYRAFTEYFAMWQPIQGGSIWTGINKSDKAQGGFSKRAAQKLITATAAKYGITDFAAHDCRHAWTDKALDAGNDIVTIQHAGGWKNITMVSYYAAKKEVSNAGLKGFN